MEDPNNELQGIKGWLIVVGAMVVIGPLYMLAVLPKVFKDFFYGPQWAALSTPGATGVHWGWKQLALMEVSFSVAAFLGSMVLFCLFFGKKRDFPNLFIAMHIVTAVFHAAVVIAIYLLAGGQVPLDSATIVGFFQTVVPPLIWIPYMLKSKRVKHTFVQ